MAKEEKTFKKIKVKLVPNHEYGKSIRKGASGKVYEFSTRHWTEVLVDDLKGFQDPKNSQYEKYLVKEDA